MNNMVAAFTAGFIATLVLSLLMAVQGTMGLVPQADYIGLVTEFANAHMQLPPYPTAGWVIHYFVGVVIYGLLLALLNDLVHNYSTTFKAIALSVFFWLVMMVVIMPVLGYGLLGLDMGPVAPLVTFVYHVIFGAVLGWSYDKLHKPEADQLP